MNAEKVIAALLDSDSDAATVISRLDEVLDAQDEQNRNELKQLLADEGFRVIFEMIGEDDLVRWHVKIEPIHPVSFDFYEKRIKEIVRPYAKGEIQINEVIQQEVLGVSFRQLSNRERESFRYKLERRLFPSG